jgi:hypothetical protein
MHAVRKAGSGVCRSASAPDATAPAKPMTPRQKKATALVLGGVVAVGGVALVLGGRDIDRREFGGQAAGRLCDRERDARDREAFGSRRAEAAFEQHRVAWTAFVVGVRASGGWGTYVLDCSPDKRNPDKMMVAVGPGFTVLAKRQRLAVAEALGIAWQRANAENQRDAGRSRLELRDSSGSIVGGTRALGGYYVDDD